jgi:hypothetical protein
MQLPDANEPLVLADGTKIDPATGKVIRDQVAKFISVPSPSDAQKLVVKARKTVADLPAPPKQLSGVALVAFYTLFGLGDSDIALALDSRLSIEQIKQIKKSEAYIDFMAAAKDNIVNTETDTVREVFQTHAKNAAHKIVELADSENDVLAFKASQDILDRAGHRPADIIEHRHTMEDALQIIITKRDDTQQMPTIDADAIEVDND